MFLLERFIVGISLQQAETRAFPQRKSSSFSHSEVEILDQRLAVLNDLYSFLQTQLEVKHSNKLEPWRCCW